MLFACLFASLLPCLLAVLLALLLTKVLLVAGGAKVGHEAVATLAVRAIGFTLARISKQARTELSGAPASELYGLLSNLQSLEKGACFACVTGSQLVPSSVACASALHFELLLVKLEFAPPLSPTSPSHYHPYTSSGHVRHVRALGPRLLLATHVCQWF